MTGIGRIAGVSGIFREAMSGDRSPWRYAFLIGLAIAGAIAIVISPGTTLTSDASLAGILIAGIVGGVGVKLARGCTSGHGVCGLGRFSFRSLVAGTVFFVLGTAATVVVRGAF